MELPKNKALELYNQSAKYAHANLFSFRAESHNTNCKKLAHNVANEVLSEVIRLDKKFNLGLEGTKQFWMDVKTEIENIKPIEYEK